MNPTDPIREAARSLVRELHLLDGRHCIEGFSFSECHLLTEVEKLDVATASELAERLVLEKSTVSRLVNGLLERGFLQAAPDTGDRRRRILRLTSKGRDGVQRIHRYARRQVSRALDCLAPADRHLVETGLSRYARALRYARLGEQYAVRTIRRRDNAAVAALIRQVMTEFGAVGEGYSIEDAEVDDMQRHYRAPEARFWVVDGPAGIVGCGGFAPLTGGPGDTCELRKMYFIPAARGLGLGTRLLNRILSGARNAGFSRCYLETLGNMDAARHLYAKHGFQAIDAPLGHTGHSGCNRWMIVDLQ